MRFNFNFFYFPRYLRSIHFSQQIAFSYSIFQFKFTSLAFHDTRFPTMTTSNRWPQQQMCYTHLTNNFFDFDSRFASLALNHTIFQSQQWISVATTRNMPQINSQFPAKWSLYFCLSQQSFSNDSNFYSCLIFFPSAKTDLHIVYNFSVATQA